MTASAFAPGTRVARPRIPFFWWLNETRHDTATPVGARGAGEEDV